MDFDTFLISNNFNNFNQYTSILHRDHRALQARWSRWSEHRPPEAGSSPASGGRCVGPALADSCSLQAQSSQSSSSSCPRFGSIRQWRSGGEGEGEEEDPPLNGINKCIYCYYNWNIWFLHLLSIFKWTLTPKLIF